jgi:ATP-dependent Clp protease ATP-binding subunit ClpA
MDTRHEKSEVPAFMEQLVVGKTELAKALAEYLLMMKMRFLDMVNTKT